MIIDSKYELMKVLGQGGFGIVWLARNIHTNELVALKIMQLSSDEQSDLKVRERFMREIQIALILEHPHVLSALDYGYTPEGGNMLPYLVSPYIPDGSLADVIRHTPPWEHWTLLQTADVILQAAQGLQYLHTREPKIVHQDVKPANFLIRWQHGQGPKRIVHVYLSDFGISRWLRTADDKTGQVVGTLIYLAPEQLDGNITWTSDQYSLAIIAHLLLTGSRPTRDAANERDSSWMLPSQLNPQRIPSPAIDEILLKALKYNPKHRFPSILAFAEALYEAIAQTDSSSDEHTEADVRRDPDVPTSKRGYVFRQQAQPAQSPPDEKLPPIDL